MRHTSTASIVAIMAMEPNDPVSLITTSMARMARPLIHRRRRQTITMRGQHHVVSGVVGLGELALLRELSSVR